MFIRASTSYGKNGKKYISHSLCQSFREGKKVRTRTICPLKGISDQEIAVLKDGLGKNNDQKISIASIEVEKSIDYGYFFVIKKLIE